MVTVAFVVKHYNSMHVRRILSTWGTSFRRYLMRITLITLVNTQYRRIHVERNVLESLDLKGVSNAIKNKCMQPIGDDVVMVMAVMVMARVMVMVMADGVADG